LTNEIGVIFKDFKTFTFNDVRIALRDRHNNISDKTIQVTLSRMAKSKGIYPVIKGVFSLERKDEIVGFAFAPFYYGGLAALMIRDLVDNQVKMEIMTTRRVKKSFITVYNGDSKVILHHIPKKYYFGFEDLKYGNIVVPVSNPEKTLIDMFYYKEKLSPHDYEGIVKGIRKEILEEYLTYYDNHTKATVMRFFLKYSKLAKAGKLKNLY
jgi:hypothetical protein